MRSLLALLLISWLWCIAPMVGYAQQLPRAGGQIEMDGALGTDIYGVDFNEFSFGDFGVVDQEGFISDEWNDEAGYEVGRTWSAGDRLDTVLKVGDVVDGLGADKLSVQQIGDTIGRDIGQASLSEFELLTDQTLFELSENLDYLSEFEVDQVEPIKALLEQEVGADLSDVELGAIANIPEYGELKLSQLDSDLLAEFKIDDIPNADIAQLGDFERYKDSPLSEIPGLSELPLSEFPKGVGAEGGIVARIDVIYGPAEDHRTNTISGSYQEGFEVPCSEEGRLVNPSDSPVQPAKCAYIALDDLENVGRKIQGDFEGKQWISGKYHEVEGGFGPLKFVPSALGYSIGYEPTGRHPFGEAFKVVVWEPKEPEDEVTSKLFFRWCAVIAGQRTCTPYNQFSVPFLTHKINALIFVGPLDGQGGSSAAPPGASNYSPTGFGIASVPPRQGPCTGEVIDGISLDTLADGIAAIESKGSGDYNAVGVYTCYGDTCGRALGRYQTMSYLPEVQSRVASKPGGREFLDKISVGYQPTPQEVAQYYPPELQEEAFQDEIGQLFDRARSQIDPQTGRRFEGNRVIERVAQMWFGGPGSTIDAGFSDVHGRLSLYDYGVEVRQHYIAQGGQPSNNCVAVGAGLNGQGGVPTGTFQNPLNAYYPITSPYGPRNIGCIRSKFHPGVDLATPIGTPVGAADGGVVQFASCQVWGYGCTIVIDHGNGRKTRYSHLANLGVRQGQAVEQGQQIAQTGNTDGGTAVSTGPHLDFGIYLNDNTGAGQLPPRQNSVDPQQYIQF